MLIRVRAVDGARVLDQRTVGGRRRYVGYQMTTDGEKTVLGKTEPRQVSTFVGGMSDLPATPERHHAFYRSCILDGDLDYVCHVDAKGKETFDRALVNATKKNVERRAIAKVTADAAEAAALEAESTFVAESDDSAA